MGHENEKKICKMSKLDEKWVKWGNQFIFNNRFDIVEENIGFNSILYYIEIVEETNGCNSILHY